MQGVTRWACASALHTATKMRLPVWQMTGIRAISQSKVLRMEESDKPFYLLGVEVASQFGQLKQDLQGANEIKAFIGGIEAVFHDNVDKDLVANSQKYANEVSNILMARRAEREAPAKLKIVEDSKAGSKVLLEKAVKEAGAFQTASGLIVNHLVAGTGSHPALESEVTVHYEGKLHDGTVFDSSIARNEPISFALNRVVPGWTEGLQLMKAGGKAKLTIPSELAYGAAGAGPIPPYAALEFEVELLSFK